VEHLGDRVEELDLFPSTTKAWEWHKTIMETEMAVNLEAVWDKGADQVSESLRAQLARGREIPALDYLRALASIAPMLESFTELLERRYDAILTPAAPGPAPKGLGSTGDPVFCTPWTLCGMPAISVPLMQGSNNLPIGVQLVGPREGDARLLRTAHWLVRSLEG
jgi:Asp-tRNA(Asn)/Glu-tRNA(Gln) amidotransferase A subunit family amidase